ncbi:NACHT, LRR and PYD domains-containing protein 1a allele 3-like isoform X2 [Lissotriton helveticus]
MNTCGNVTEEYGELKSLPCVHSSHPQPIMNEVEKEVTPPDDSLNPMCHASPNRLVQDIFSFHACKIPSGLGGASWSGTYVKSESENICLEDKKATYKKHIIKVFRLMKDEQRRYSEYGTLKEKYQTLILSNYCLMEKKCYETISSGLISLADVKQLSKCSSNIRSLFDPEENGREPRTVVLLGAAGVGKTMTAQKIMLDWASGELFQDRFEYVFYISCDNHNQLNRELTVKALIECNKPENVSECENEPLISRTEMEAEPSKVLFIIDGFDETSPEDDTLISLIGKEYLPESYNIITTQPAALETLKQFLPSCEEDVRFAEILGFSEDDRKEYFINYFGNTTEGELVYKNIEENDLLFTMCFVPVVCGVVCQPIKQKIEKEEECVAVLRTTASVYLLFLSSLLEQTSRDTAQSIFNLYLKRLCALANEGLYEGKTQFEDSDITRHGLDIPPIQSLFLNNEIFRKVDGADNLYCFLHLSFRDFFAALFYVLKDHETTTESPERDVINLLEDYRNRKHDHQLMLTVRFLFGLLRRETIDLMEKDFQWSVSLDLKPAVEKWIKEVILLESVRIGDYELDLFNCLYETQDEDFVRSATEHVKQIIYCEPLLARLDATDTRALVFSLQHSVGVVQIDLSVKIEREGLRLLMPGLMKCSILRMYECSLTGSCCADLASFLRTNTSLTTLDLSFNKLGDSGVRELCEGLKDPLCTLRTLSLQSVGLTDDVTRPLCLALRRNQTLQKLNLLSNNFTERSTASFHALEECVLEISLEVLFSDYLCDDETFNEEENAYCYRATLDKPGTFLCEETGLCFEVGKAGTITYKLLPWSDNLSQCGVEHMQFAGSLFDVTADPGFVRAIYLPHFVDLRDGNTRESKLQIAHFGANGEMTLEAPSEVQAFHVVLRNPTFSPIGVVLRLIPPLRRQFPFYGQTILYRAIQAADITLHLYLIPDEAHIKKTLERCAIRKQKIEKPPQTQPVYFSSWYSIESQPHSEIKPKNLQFTERSSSLEPPFTEIYMKHLQKEGVDLCLKDEEGNNLVWDATVRQGDIDFKLKENPRTPEPFIKKHRERLIGRMGTIESIMDILLGAGVLTDEEVECVVAKKTRSKQNRKLIQMVMKKGTESMGEFLIALRKKDPLLYNDLEKCY